jgi:hypothetical protein
MIRLICRPSLVSSVAKFHDSFLVPLSNILALRVAPMLGSNAMHYVMLYNSELQLLARHEAPDRAKGLRNANKK